MFEIYMDESVVILELADGYKISQAGFSNLLPQEPDWWFNDDKFQDWKGERPLTNHA